MADKFNASRPHISIVVTAVGKQEGFAVFSHSVEQQGQGGIFVHVLLDVVHCHWFQVALKVRYDAYKT